jgi:hypothetical protein
MEIGFGGIKVACSPERVGGGLSWVPALRRHCIEHMAPWVVAATGATVAPPGSLGTVEIIAAAARTVDTPHRILSI